MNNGEDIEVTEIPGGRIIKPTGSIFRLSEKTISQMTDIELRAHIINLKTMLQARKHEVDSLTIQVSQAQHEQGSRDEKHRIKLRNIKVPIVRQKAKSPTASTTDAFNQVVSTLQKKGLSPTEIVNILLKLKQTGGK